MSNSDRVVITVVGQDRVGIVAGVSAALAEMQINIVDISQTIMSDLFTMIMLVDISDAKYSLDVIKQHLNKKAQELGVQILAQHEEIFRFMHRV
jgi:ACT domain-containing protein